MKRMIVVIPGDGIGPQLIDQTVKVLKRVGENFGHEFTLKKALAGGCAIDALGVPLPQATLDLCRQSHAVLLGAVGGPQWDAPDVKTRPEEALLGLRKGLGLFANIRPAYLFDALREACPLRPDIASRGIDLCIVRELTGGIYFGPKGKKGQAGEAEAYDTEIYATSEVERIARVAFQIAASRRKKVTNVDKANILESSRLWRSVVIKVSQEFPDIELGHLYVDNAAMQLVRDPQQFDVILTTNMFGDILSDEASVVAGSIGMLPSASLGQGSLGLYEPVHGSAPDIVGQDLANPIATILSAAMMLRYSLGLPDEAGIVEKAVALVLERNFRTKDIMSAGKTLVGTREMTRLIIDAVGELSGAGNSVGKVASSREKERTKWAGN